MEDEQPQITPSKTALLTPDRALIVLLVILGIIIAAELLIVVFEQPQALSRLTQVNSKWTIFNKGRPIEDIAIDSQGVVWSVSGDNKIRSVKGDTITTPITSIFNLEIDSQDRKWIGTFLGEVAVQNAPEVWQIYRPEDPATGREHETGGDMIYDMVIDKQGMVWIKNYRGLGIIYPSQAEDPYPVGDPISGLAVDLQGQAWVATDGFYTMKTDGQWQKRGNTGSASFAFDHKDRIWTQTYYPNGNFARLDPDETLSIYDLDRAYSGGININVTAILADRKDRIWIGTDYGLFVFDPDQQMLRAYLPENSGLPDSSVNALALDDHDQLWIATRKGLAMIAIGTTIPEAVSPMSWDAPFTVWLHTVRDVILPLAAFGVVALFGAAFAYKREGTRSGAIQFLTGAAILVLVNVVFWGVAYLLFGSAKGPEFIVWALPMLCWPPFNILVLLILGIQTKKRGWITLGALWIFLEIALSVAIVMTVSFWRAEISDQDRPKTFPAESILHPTVIAPVHALAASPTPQATAIPSTPKPTAIPPTPAPTAFPVKRVDLASLLIQDGDLPNAMRGTDILDVNWGFAEGMPTPDKANTQLLTYMSREAGFVSVVLYEDATNTKIAYQAHRSTRNYEEISGIGEMAALFSFPETSTLKETRFVFVRCHAFVMIFFQNLRDIPGIEAYAQKLDARLTEAVCP